MKQIAVIGIDLAKNVFQVHGPAPAGTAVLSKKLSRAQMIEFFSKITPCLIGVEACSSAHYWGRRLTEMGHTVKLMPPQYVKPYVKTNKNDARDAEAICEAVTRPNMRFVPIKTVEQQAVLALHRVHDGIVKQRTALSNQIRGLLAEFGIVAAKGSKQLNACMTHLLSDPNSTLPVNLQKTFSSLFQELINLTARVKEFDKQIESHVKATDECLRILQIEGVGVLTATAVVASVGDIRNFKSASQFAAWLGLVPRQNSSGGKTQLLGISKRGDVYLRTLLVHGARSLIRQAQLHPERYAWLTALIGRSNANIAAVALANKNARIAWALMAHDKAFEANYRSAHNRPESAVPDNR